jgi:hypothetical protein
MLDERDREAAESILREWRVTRAWYSTLTDESEDVFFVSAEDYDHESIGDLTLELMQVLPHRKIWVTRWSEQSGTARLF